MGRPIGVKVTGNVREGSEGRASSSRTLVPDGDSALAPPQTSDTYKLSSYRLLPKNREQEEGIWWKMPTVHVGGHVSNTKRPDKGANNSQKEKIWIAECINAFRAGFTGWNNNIGGGSHGIHFLHENSPIQPLDFMYLIQKFESCCFIKV